jgi:hypothetical protein
LYAFLQSLFQAAQICFLLFHSSRQVLHTAADIPADSVQSVAQEVVSKVKKTAGKAVAAAKSVATKAAAAKKTTKGKK